MKKLFSLCCALLLCFALAACSGAGAAADRGDLGKEIETEAFAFTANNAYLCDKYESYTPVKGHQLLVVDVTVVNTSGDEHEMYDVDFWAQWGNIEDDEYAWPITWDAANFADLPTVSDAQLPSTYTLAKDEGRTGELVFEVPLEIEKFSLCHQDVYEDGTYGETVEVKFTAEPAEEGEAASSSAASQASEKDD